MRARLWKAKYAVTFEFTVKQPVTIRGEVEAKTYGALINRAVREAKRNSKGQTINWSSISVLIDRYDEMKTTVESTVESELTSSISAASAG